MHCVDDTTQPKTPDGVFPIKKYKAGDIVESDIDLVAKWGAGRFTRVSRFDAVKTGTKPKIAPVQTSASVAEPLPEDLTREELEAVASERGVEVNSEESDEDLRARLEG